MQHLRVFTGRPAGSGLGQGLGLSKARWIPPGLRSTSQSAPRGSG
jgi:hypothetical protein